MAKETKDSEIIDALNAVLEHELSGVVRYTHYSLMIFGHNRIPIVKWLQEQGSESLAHAQQVGEHITSLGGHPSLKIAKLLESHKHAINDILNETLDHESVGLQLYYDLLKLVENKSVWLEEFVRTMILEEEMHISEVRKMLKAPK